MKQPPLVKCVSFLQSYSPAVSSLQSKLDRLGCVQQGARCRSLILEEKVDLRKQRRMRCNHAVACFKYIVTPALNQKLSLILPKTKAESNTAWVKDSAFILYSLFFILYSLFLFSLTSHQVFVKMYRGRYRKTMRPRGGGGRSPPRPLASFRLPQTRGCRCAAPRRT